MNVVNLHIGKLNLYYMAYIQNGKESEREREKERESTLQDHVCYVQIFFHVTLYGKLYFILYVAYMVIMGKLFPSSGINELEFFRQNQKFSSTYP